MNDRFLSPGWWVKIHQWLLRKPQRINYPWIAGAMMFLGWLVSILLGPGNFDLAGNVVGTDYLQFYTAGLTLRKGQGDRLYDFAYQHELQQQVVAQETTHYYAFLTPPFFAWLFLPFSIFPYSVSYALFCLLTLVGVWFSLRLLGVDKPMRPFLWSLSFFPIFANLSFGQNGVLSLFLLASSWFFWKNEQSRYRLFLAGVVLSLLLFKPQLTLGILFFWLLDWQKSWRSLLGFSLGAGTLAVLSLGLLPESSKDYIMVARQVLPTITTWEGFPLWHTVTWRGFLLLLLNGLQPYSDSLSMVLTILGLVLFVVIWRRWRNKANFLFSAAVGLSLWISPHALIYDWAILIVPAVLLWQVLPDQRDLLRACYALVWIVGLVNGPLTIVQLAILPVAIQLAMPFLCLVMVTLYRNITIHKIESQNEIFNL